VGWIVLGPHAFMGNNILIGSNGPTSIREGGVVLSQSHPIARVASCPKKKKESWNVVVAYHKEVKAVVAHRVMPPRTFIPIDEIGEITQLKGVWQQAIKDSTYRHLDLNI
jgi:hypothetical protein